MKIALLATTILLGLSAPISATPEISPFSMQLHSMMGDTKAHADTCALVKAAGIKIIRDEICWRLVETEKGVIKWPERCDTNVDTTLAAGLTPMIILDYGNPFYDNGNAPDSPEGVAGYARYCREMAAHYKGKIKYWEIWNEGNTDYFWKPKADPAKYTEVLKAAWKACKQANPDCVVVGVCTAGVDLRFIKAVLERGAMEYMDILSVHPYCYPSPPELSISGQIAKVRELMDSHGGKAKPIWVTEVGWPTHIGANGVTPEVQAHMIVRTYLECIASGVQTVFWYWFGNDGPNPNYNEDHFGIRFQDGSPKPAYTAYQTMTKMLEGSDHVRPLALGAKCRAQIFRRGDETVAALWAVEGLRTVTLNVGSGPVEVTGELGGKPTVLYPVDGLVGLTLSGAPIYLKCDEDLTQNAVRGFNPFEIAPLEAEMPAGSPATFSLRINNPTSSVLSGEIDYGLSDQTMAREPFRVAAHGSAVSQLKVTPPVGAQGIVPLSVTLLIDGRPAALLQSRVKIVQRLKLTLLPLTSANGKGPAMGLDVTNRSAVPISGTIVVECEPQVLLVGGEISLRDFAPGRTSSYKIRLAQADAAPDQLYKVTAKAVESRKDAEPIIVSQAMDFMASRRADRPIVVDGNLEEWAGAAPIHLDRKDQMTFGRDRWKGPADSSGEVFTLWDEENLYIAAAVADDVHCNSIYGHYCYKNDGLEVYLDIDRPGDIERHRYSEDDFQYGFFDSPKGPIVWRWGNYDAISPGAKIAINLANDLGPDKNRSGYRLEGSIPLKELGLKPSTGMRIGFSVSINDDDLPNDDNVQANDSRMIWAGGNDNWLDPTLMGELFLTH